MSSLLCNAFDYYYLFLLFYRACEQRLLRNTENPKSYSDSLFSPSFALPCPAATKSISVREGKTRAKPVQESRFLTRVDRFCPPLRNSKSVTFLRLTNFALPYIILRECLNSARCISLPYFDQVCPPLTTFAFRVFTEGGTIHRSESIETESIET